MQPLRRRTRAVCVGDGKMDWSAANMHCRHLTGPTTTSPVRQTETRADIAEGL